MGFVADILGIDDPAPPQAPNYAPIAQASERAAELGYQAAGEDLAFRKQVYADSQPRQQQLLDMANRVVNQQLGIGDMSQRQAEDQWQYYRSTFQPLERATTMDAIQSQYLSADDLADLQAHPERYGAYAKLAADRAAAEQSRGYYDMAGRNVRDLEGLRDSELGFLRGRELQDREGIQASINSNYGQQSRQLARLGMGDPNRMAALAAQMANQQTLARVGGMNQLSRDYAQLAQGVRQGYGQQIYGQQAGAREADRATQAGRYAQGIGLRTGAANFGRNMPNTAGQAFGLAMQAGNSAMGNQNAAFMSGLPYAQLQAGGYGTQLAASGLAQQGALGMGNVLNQGFGVQAGLYNTQQNRAAAEMEGLGSLAGMGFGMR